MSWSQAEVIALAVKAARGAGAPPAQAARFGQATACHLARDRPAEQIQRALAALPEGPVMAFALDIDRLLIAAAQGGGNAVELQAGGFAQLLKSYAQTLPFWVSFAGSADEVVRVNLDGTAAPEPRRAARIEGCEALIAEMSAWAARTFVPDSDTSRCAGAGAGLSDTD